MNANKPNAAGAAAGGATSHPVHPEGLAHLIKMANDIGHFFQAEERHEDAVVGVANHISKYWTPRMREKILTYLKGPADAQLPAIEALPREALERIAHPSAKPVLAPGGDPGGDAG